MDARQPHDLPIWQPGFRQVAPASPDAARSSAAAAKARHRRQRRWRRQPRTFAGVRSPEPTRPSLACVARARSAHWRAAENRPQRLRATHPAATRAATASLALMAKVRPGSVDWPQPANASTGRAPASEQSHRCGRSRHWRISSAPVPSAAREPTPRARHALSRRRRQEACPCPILGTRRKAREIWCGRV